MKKQLFIFILLALSFFFRQDVFAQSPVASAGAAMKVEYELPYPGILPDNVFYYLKAIRDNIQKFLITDPLKKAEFDLLQSDKRLAASKALFDKGKDSLSITTLSKSGNYFEDAISNIRKAKEQGSAVDKLLDRLYISSQKHQEIILEMEKDKTRKYLLELKFYEDRAHDFQERVAIVKSI